LATCLTRLCLAFTLAAAARSVAAQGLAAPIRTSSGAIEGVPATKRGIRAYLGIPFAAPPVGALRWREPPTASSWTGVRKATTFGPRCTQAPVFSDMIFRDSMSEDCLYLNVWTPARTAANKLPVMVWIYGGGFQGGSASEPRQDGTHLAEHGLVVVSMNYRLGVFGFLAHPELTAESGERASGNYGLQDQLSALRWVRDNIAAFGGDTSNVTIFGESAGSFAVSALLASPLSKGLVHKAIGESGAFFGATLGAAQRSAAEAQGVSFASDAGASTIADLRALSADSVLTLSRKNPTRRFSAILDGLVLPRNVSDLYAEGAQRHVPLLAGWNAAEVRSSVTLSTTPTTAAFFSASMRTRFGANADEVLRVYPATSDSTAIESAASFNSDQFIAFGTWQWLEAHRETSGSAVYRYLFARQIPIASNTVVNGHTATARDIGARHAGEIEYVFGALPSVPNVMFTLDDSRLSEQMMRYWSNFAKTGNPNGKGLPVWPVFDAAKGNQVMTLDVTSKAAPERNRARYEMLENAARQHP